MIFNLEKIILTLLKKKDYTFNNILKETNSNKNDLQNCLNDLINNNMIEKNKRHYCIKENLELIDSDTTNYSEQEMFINQVDSPLTTESYDNSLENEDLNITFNKISEKDDGVKFSIDKDDDNNKVVNLNLNLILEISDKYSRQYKN